MKRTSGYFISVANNRLPRENSQKSFIYVTYNMVYLNVNRQSKNGFHFFIHPCKYFTFITYVNRD